MDVTKCSLGFLRHGPWEKCPPNCGECTTRRCHICGQGLSGKWHSRASEKEVCGECGGHEDVMLREATA